MTTPFSTTDSRQPQKLAPNSQESEEAVLGSVLINPEVLPDLIAFLDGDDFYFLHHRFVWECFLSINERSEAIDALTITEELRYRRDRDGQTYLDKVGGSAFVTYLINNTPTHIHVETYGRIVERLAVRRRMLDAGSNIAKAALNDDIELEEALDRGDKAWMSVTRPQTDDEMMTAEDATKEYFNELYERARQITEGAPLGIPTGYKKIDELLGGGLQRTDLVLVAARPGVGKTSFALSVVFNSAQGRSIAGRRIEPVNVAIFSLEMSRQQVMQRLFSNATNVDSRKLRSGDLSDKQWENVIQSSVLLERLRLRIDDKPRLTITRLRRKLRRLVMSGFNPDLVVIDYIQLMYAPGYGSNTVAMYSEISRSLKEIAKEFNTTVLAAAQVSRGVEGRDDKRPMLSDLKDSGSFEQDGDVIMFLYDDYMYNPKTAEPNNLEIIVAKQRNGPTGKDIVYFHKEATRIAPQTGQQAP